MTKLRQLYRCELCGNVTEVCFPGAEALVCCGQPMNLLEPKTADSTTEKHVPYKMAHNGGTLVKVGETTAHPMMDAHYIAFIEIMTKDRVCRAELNPGDLPEAWFPVAPEDIVEAREFCNLHMLWKS